MKNEKKNILIVDDDLGTRYMIRRLLVMDKNSAAYEVEEAENGCEAEIKLKMFPADLIILDFMMPERDGCETCRHIRQALNMRDVKIIGISGACDEVGENFIRKFGADCFLQKPFSSDELRDMVSGLLKGGEKNEEGRPDNL